MITKAFIEDNLMDKLGRISSNYLKQNNLTSEEAHKIYYDIDETPLCKICKNPVKYMGFRRGYYETCSVKCANKIRLENTDKVYDTESFIKKAKEVHGDLYDYSKVVYKGAHEHVKILCRVHGEFEQLPYNHTMGKHCEKCSYFEREKTVGWSRDRYKNKKTILYYIKVDNLYKIGITSRTINERFSKEELKKIEIISIETFEDGVEAFDKELEILRKNVKNKYRGEKRLISGNTELFTEKIVF